jgi:mRNA-degrading endonuclease toxin of MazEF toxin-antitoxin module
MPALEPLDVAAVPFPCVEHEARKRRPAVVVPAPELADRHGLLRVVVVTSGAKPR